MNGFRILFALDTADAAGLASFHRVAQQALAFDGYAPFNEQALYDLQNGLRTAYLVTVSGIAVSTGSTNGDGHVAEASHDSGIAVSTGSTNGDGHVAEASHDSGTAVSTGSTNGDGHAAEASHDSGIAVSTGSTSGDGTEAATTIVVGAALGGRGEIDLVISPEYRRRGYGRAAARELSATEANGLTAWSHGDHPAARALASELRFVAARTLLELRMPLFSTDAAPEAEAASASGAAASAVAGARISAFRPGADDAEWVALNALIFATHPEQGAITEADLSARQAESWFSADDFLILRDAAGRMIGYNWLKVDGAIGEIYVVGVHPDFAGKGLGRVLMQAGLQRLADAGCTTAALYVEADSVGPVHLYRALGFVDHTVDVQYRRLSD